MTALRVTHSAAGRSDLPTGWPFAAPRTPQTLSQTRMRALVDEVEERTEAIVGSTRERMDALRGAVMAVSSELNLDAVSPNRIKASAVSYCRDTYWMPSRCSRWVCRPYAQPAVCG